MANNTYKISIKDDASKKVGSIQSQVKGLQNSIGNLVKGFVSFKIVEQGFQALAGFVGDSTKAFLESEKATNRLRGALKLAGQDSTQNIKRIKEFGSELQKTMGLSDDAVVEVTGKLVALGKSIPEAERLTRAGANLAAVLGVDLAQATDMLTKSYQGNAGQMGRLIPEIGKLTKEQLANGDALTIIEAKYNGFAESINQGVSGNLKTLENNFSDLMKTIGEIGANALDPIIEKLGQAVEQYNRALTTGQRAERNMASQRQFTPQAYLSMSKTETNIREFRDGLKDLVDGIISAQAGYKSRLDDMLRKAGQAGMFTPQQITELQRGGNVRMLEALVQKRVPGADALNMLDGDKIRQNQANYTGLRQWQDLLKVVEQDFAKKYPPQPAQAPRLSSATATTAPAGATAPTVELSTVNKAQIMADKEERARVYNILMLERLEMERKASRSAWEAFVEDGEEATREIASSLASALGPSLQIGGQLINIFDMVRDAQIKNEEIVLRHHRRAFEERQASYQKELETKKSMGEDTLQFELDKEAQLKAEKEALEAQEKENKKKAWKAEQESKLTSAIMGGANAFISALALPFPFNWVQAGLVGASTAVQTGLIMSQQMPSFRTGTKNVPYDMTANIHKGEMIITKPFADSIRDGELNLGGSAGDIVINIGTVYGADAKELSTKIYYETKKLLKTGALV